MNRGLDSKNRFGVRGSASTEMPKEPRRVPTVLGRVHERPAWYGRVGWLLKASKCSAPELLSPFFRSSVPFRFLPDCYIHERLNNFVLGSKRKAKSRTQLPSGSEAAFRLS